MTTFYRVFNHDRLRSARRFAIDETDAEGHYRSMIAYWYPTSAAAKLDAARLIAEDASRGRLSVLLKSVASLADL